MKRILFLLLLAPGIGFASTPAELVTYQILQSTMSIPVLNVQGGASGEPYRIDFATGATLAQVRAAYAIANAADVSPTALAAFDTVEATFPADSVFTQSRTVAALLRAILALVLDELNTLRQWEMSYKSAVAASTSLANLQTRVAALPDLPDRTASQLRTALKNKLDSGS